MYFKKKKKVSKFSQNFYGWKMDISNNLWSFFFNMKHVTNRKSLLLQEANSLIWLVNYQHVSFPLFVCFPLLLKRAEPKFIDSTILPEQFFFCGINNQLPASVLFASAAIMVRQKLQAQWRSPAARGVVVFTARHKSCNFGPGWRSLIKLQAPLFSVFGDCVPP